MAAADTLSQIGDIKLTVEFQMIKRSFTFLATLVSMNNLFFLNERQLQNPDVSGLKRHKLTDTLSRTLDSSCMHSKLNVPATNALRLFGAELPKVWGPPLGGGGDGAIAGGQYEKEKNPPTQTQSRR